VHDEEEDGHAKNGDDPPRNEETKGNAIIHIVVE